MELIPTVACPSPAGGKQPESIQVVVRLETYPAPASHQLLKVHPHRRVRWSLATLPLTPDTQSPWEGWPAHRKPRRLPFAPSSCSPPRMSPAMRTAELARCCFLSVD